MSNIRKMLNISRKLKMARREAGYSQKELGQILKLSDKAISSYEVGRSMPSLDILDEIAKLTNKPINYFLDEEPDGDLNLKIKLDKIEREIAEIKGILAHREE
jgi:transcriptional regulator with XRE-family HTH domain